MFPRSMIASSFVSFVACVFIGCGTETRTNEPDTVPVSGTVLLDGQPLASGRVQFIDREETPPREYVAEVIDGTFSGSASPGRKRIEIRAWRTDVETSVGGSPTDVDPQYIPARYNASSELEAEIPPDGASALKFDLTLAEQ